MKMASIEHPNHMASSSSSHSSNGKAAPEPKLDLSRSSSSSSSSTTTTTTTEMPVPTRFVAECKLPNQFGEFRLRGYRRGSDEPTAVVLGDVSSGGDVLVRIHDQCFTSEVLGSQRCDCKEQLDMAFMALAKEGRGVIVYLQQEGRGIGLANKIAAYSLQDQGLDTVEANHKLGFLDELRSYECVPDILDDLGISSVRLMTNNPFKVKALRDLGVGIAERLPLLVPSTDNNRNYMRTKALRMAHILPPDIIDNEGARSAAAAVPTNAPAPRPHEDEAVEVEVFVNPHDGKEHRWEMGRESVVAAIEAVKRGEMVVVTDDASRENEGDIIMAAELATTETLAFTVRYTGGVICVAMPDERMKELELPPMLAENQDPKETAFTVTVDCNVDTTTGISAKDRAQTMRMLADPKSTPGQFTRCVRRFCTDVLFHLFISPVFPFLLPRPGHIFPLRAREGGVLVRDGHTEASVDLCRMAGLSEAGLLSEIVTKDSTDMARMPELVEFCDEHKLVLTTIEDMICYRLSEGV